MKLAVFHPKARDAIRSFPEDIRREVGKLIFDLQKGERLSMPLSRPMPSVAPAVEELRVKDRSGAYRVFYYTRLADSILIFHAFAKLIICQIQNGSFCPNCFYPNDRNFILSLF